MTERTSSTAFLKDVVAYVDVWSSSRMEDYSDLFIQQLLDMGAEVSKTLNKQVTHVVFKHGRPSTWKKAQKMGVRIVSVHWVARCKETYEHVDEDLFPAQNEESKLQLMKKRTHHCMQPKDIPLKTPENDRRLKKKIDKMMEELIPPSPVVSDTSPFIIDEQSGSVYSPSLRRSDSMAQRLREMRAQREHLSPSEDMTLDCFSTSHCDPLKKRDKQEKQNHNKRSIMKISRKQVNHKSPESDTALAMCNLACVERNIEVPTLSSKSQQSLESKTTGKKQTTLKSFINKTCSERKHSPHLNLETESTGIYPELSGSLERAKSPLPKNLRNTIYCNSESIKDYKEQQTSCKYLYSRKLSSANCCFTENEDDQNNKPIISNPVHKCQHQSSATLHSEVVDDEVFEDYFSPVSNALKRRVILFGLSSDEVHMPTFDLEDSNKKGKRGDKKTKTKKY